MNTLSSSESKELSPLELFRVAYSLGSQKASMTKNTIETMHSTYTNHRLGKVEEERLKTNISCCTTKLRDFEVKIAEEKEILDHCKAFLFPRLSQETEELYKDRMAKKPPLGDLDQIQRRLLAAGKFKDKNPSERDAIFNEIVEKRIQYMQIEPFIYGVAERNISTLEANLQFAEQVFEDFKKKDIPKSEDAATQRIFETILHFQTLEAKKEGSHHE